MKTFKNSCAAVMLTLVLALSASAGHMHTTVADPPPPPPTEGQMGTGVADGQIEIGVAGQIHTLNSVPSPVDPLTEMALSLWQSLLPMI